MTRTSRITTLRAGIFLAAGFLFAAPSLNGQATPVRVEEDADCRQGDRDRDHYCEIREYSLDARPDLRVDGRQNGGIEVSGWDRDEIRLVARIRASSRDSDPRSLAEAIEIRTGATIEAEGPRSHGRDSWSVSYELQVPRRTRLDLQASNGGIGLEELEGEVDARTTNGGIHLVGGSGRVRGETTNGGLHVELTGRSWTGDGVDLQTTNGGVEIRVPDGYSAELETGTVNGGMELDIPVMVRGRIDRVLRTTLGDGGALIRATTTNGGVRIGR